MIVALGHSEDIDSEDAMEEVLRTCARATYPGDAPEAALVFSCAGRHAVLGTRVGREREQFKEHIGPDVPTIGFYTYGEFCPLSVSPTPRAHGSTFVTVLIGENE